MLPIEIKRSRLGPGANNQIMRLAKARNRVGRIDSHRIIFTANTTDKAGDDPSPAHHIQHGNFFGNPDGMIPERQSVADHGNFDTVGSPCQKRPNDIRGGHGAIGILMVLVHAHAIKAEGFRVLQLVKIAIIDVTALCRVIVFIREGDPGRGVF